MSVSLINKTINDLQVSGLQIFYDFASYSNGGTVINSIASGESAYSGAIIGADVGFTGNSSGSGYFTDQYIEIQNVTGIQEEGFTVIFSQEKTGVSPGVIYSDMDPGGPSGCEIGIAASNQLYFKNYVNGAPSYVTMDNTPCDKNIYAVSVNNFGLCVLNRLSFASKEEVSFVYQFNNQATGDTRRYYNMERKSFIVPAHTISNGNSWRVGSGEFSYKGYMDYFLYFDRFLGTSTIKKLTRSIYSDYAVVPEVTGTSIGPLSGYSFTKTGVSGIVGTANYISGSGTQSGFYTYQSGVAKTGFVGLSGVVYRPYSGVEGVTGSEVIAQKLYRKTTNLSLEFDMSGALSKVPLENYQSSGSYWHFSGNSGTYNGDSATGAAGTLFGITGFEMVTITGYVTGLSIPLLGYSGNSGILYSGFSSTPLRSTGNSYVGTGSYISAGQNEDESYYPRALSLVGETNSEYFYEIMFDASGSSSLNSEGLILRNSKYQELTARMTGRATDSTVNLAINGVSSFTGSPVYSTSNYNLPQVDVISGFMTSGTEIITQTSLAVEDEVIYDVVESGVKNSLTIANTGQYSSSPFTSFNITDSQVFFNGVKIYSGIDYLYAGGFTPSGGVTGMTGVYFTYPDYSGSSTVTGSGITPISVDHSAITPNGYVAFFNGVRQPFGGIVEHSRNSDLLSGTRVLNNDTNFYNMLNGVTQEKI
tara:strand:+ start:122 stop:2230 length:2109 start_codon:yes stop_codon:yes gene_type:complete